MNLSDRGRVSPPEARRQVVGVCVHGLCVMLCEVLAVGGDASLWVGRSVGGDACGIVCRVLARESGKWLG